MYLSTRLVKPARPGCHRKLRHSRLIVQGALGLACANAHAASTIMIALDTRSSRSCTQRIPRPKCVPPGTAQSVRKPHPAQPALGTRQPASASKLISLREGGSRWHNPHIASATLPSMHIPSSRGAPVARPPPMATISFPPSPHCHFRPLACTATPRAMEVECGSQGDPRLAPEQLRSAWASEGKPGN
jgi:hypothetical protein